MIETLATNGSNHSLCIGLLPGRARCRQNFAYAHASFLLPEFIAEEGIAVAQQAARELGKGKGFPEYCRPVHSAIGSAVTLSGLHWRPEQPNSALSRDCRSSDRWGPPIGALHIAPPLEVIVTRHGMVGGRNTNPARHEILRWSTWKILRSRGALRNCHVSCRPGALRELRVGHVGLVHVEAIGMTR